MIVTVLAQAQLVDSDQEINEEVMILMDPATLIAMDLVTLTVMDQVDARVVVETPVADMALAVTTTTTITNCEN